MADRSTLVALAVAGALGAAAGSIATSGVAEAGKYIIALSPTDPILTHGDWRALEDGGVKFTMCGHATKLDGGAARLDTDCVPCEAAWHGARATCMQVWKQANGI